MATAEATPAEQNEAPQKKRTPKEATPAPPASLNDALLAFQSSAPALQRDKINPHFRSKYLSLESLMEQVLPALNATGLVLTQEPGFETINGGTDTQTLVPTLTTRLIHPASGDERSSSMLLQAGKEDPQGQGAAITYARRQAAMSMLGLVADEDDDGNRASARKAPARKPAPSPDASGADGRTPDTPAPKAAPSAAQADAPNDPQRTQVLVGVANQIIQDIQTEFGDHPEGASWSKRMSDKCQEWFGHSLKDVTTAEATVLVQRLRATRTKLISDRDAGQAV